MMPEHVTIREVCLRDGLQLEDPIPLSAKLELLEAVLATGVREIEATAFVSPSKVPALADAAALAAELPRLRQSHGVEFSALFAGPGGAGRAVAAGMTSIEYVVSAADGHSQANVGRSTAESTGTTTPRRVTALVERLRPVLGELALGAHFHNTRGAGLASAYAAVTAGVRRLDSSVGGLGGCPFAPGASGNIATEDLVYMLRDSGIGVDVDLQAAIHAADVARKTVGHDLPSALLRAGDRILS
jgi:hydroxymethylglutaryl-CoA lyase